MSDGAAVRFGLFVPRGWRLDLVDVGPAGRWSAVRSVAELAVHEAWTLTAALAAVTSRVRLRQTCTCMGCRGPAHLEKVAATVDVVSGGRVEMGIGAGWYGALCHPLPLQDGGIRLGVTGGGERRTLGHARGTRGARAVHELRRRDGGGAHPQVRGAARALQRPRHRLRRDHPQRRRRRHRRRDGGGGREAPRRLPGGGHPGAGGRGAAPPGGGGHDVPDRVFPQVASDTTGVELFEREVLPALRDA